MPFSRELYIEQDDFRDPAPPKYFRLSPGAEVRLRYAYIVKCTDVKRDASGQVIEVHCAYDPDSRGGDSKGRKVKGTIHWVSAAHAVDAEVRLYDTLFTVPKPDDAEDYASVLNPNSLEVLTGAKVEPALAGVPPETHVQFERTGYFVSDWRDTRRRAPSSIARSGCATRGRRSRARGRAAYHSRHIVRLPGADAASEAWRSNSRGTRAKRQRMSVDMASHSPRPSRPSTDPLSITIHDPLHSFDEERFLLIGLSRANELLVIAHRADGDEIRVISARRASRRERRTYEEESDR